jgi:hypothetical protein
MAKEKKDAPKIQSNSAPAPMATSHAPTPRRKGRANAPGPSISGRVKAAWKASGKRGSLREYARKHETGQAWFANKSA